MSSPLTQELTPYFVSHGPQMDLFDADYFLEPQAYEKLTLARARSRKKERLVAFAAQPDYSVVRGLPGRDSLCLVSRFGPPVDEGNAKTIIASIHGCSKEDFVSRYVIASLQAENDSLENFKGLPATFYGALQFHNFLGHYTMKVHFIDELKY